MATRRRRRWQRNTYTISCGGSQTSDVPDQLLTLPYFSKVRNLFYDKQGAVSSEVAFRTIEAKLRGLDTPVKLITYKEQLLVLGRNGIYRYDPFIRDMERLQVGTEDSSPIFPPAPLRRRENTEKVNPHFESVPIFSQTNLEIDVTPVIRRETDMLFPCAAYRGHPTNKPPEVGAGQICLIAAYDTINKSIILQEYDMINKRVTKHNSFGIEVEENIPYCQGLDLIWWTKEGGSDPAIEASGYYLFMLYKKPGEQDKVAVFPVSVSDLPTPTSAISEVPINTNENVISIKAVGGRLYYIYRNAMGVISYSSAMWNNDPAQSIPLSLRAIQLFNQADNARLENGKTLHGFYPWFRARIDTRSPYYTMMWSPQTGYFMTNENSEIIAHFHADKVPTENEMIAPDSDLPKMTFSGSPFIYWKPLPDGTHIRPVNLSDPEPDFDYSKGVGNVQSNGAGQRYYCVWMFPILSTGQLETEVFPVDEPQQVDNLLIPPRFTGIKKPLGVEMVEACFGCLRPEAREINGQMLIGGGTLNYYDGTKVVERGFAEKPKIELVKNPSPWEHDTTRYIDVQSQIDSIPDNEKTQAQYTSEKKVSLYTENDTSKVWQVAVGSTSAGWNTSSYDNKPELKKPDGTDSGIAIGNLAYDPNPSGAPATGLKKITLTLTSWTSSKQGDAILPPGIVINRKLYRFQQRSSGATVTLVGWTPNNPFSGFARNAKVSLYIPQAQQYKNNAELDIELKEEASDMKEITLTNSTYRKFIEKRKTATTSEERDDNNPTLLKTIGRGSTGPGSMGVSTSSRSGRRPSYSWYLNLTSAAYNSAGRDNALNTIGANGLAGHRYFDANRDGITYSSPSLKIGTGDGGDFAGSIKAISSSFGASPRYRLFFVIDESRSGADFKKWIRDNNIVSVTVENASGGLKTYSADDIGANLATFGNFKIFELSLDSYYDQYRPRSIKFYSSGTRQSTTTEENDYPVPLGTYYSQTYKNTHATSPADLVKTDIFDNFDLFDGQNNSSVRLPQNSFLKFGAGAGAIYEKSAQIPLSWLESDEDKLINLLYIKTQTVTSTLRNTLKASVYKYVCRFKWVDTRGNEHRSQWSDPVQVLTGPRAGSKNRVIIGRLKQDRNPKTADIADPNNWDFIIVGENSSLSKGLNETLNVAPVELKVNFLNYSAKRGVTLEVYRTWSDVNTYRQVKLEDSQNNTPEEGLALRDGEILNGPYISTESPPVRSIAKLRAGKVIFEDGTENPLQPDISFRDSLRDNQLGQTIHPNSRVINGAEKIEVFNERFVLYGFPGDKNKVIVSSPIDPTKNFAVQFSETIDKKEASHELFFNEDVWRVQPLDNVLIIFTEKKIYQWGISAEGNTAGPSEITNAVGFRLKDKNAPIVSYPRGIMFVTDQNRSVTLLTGLTIKIHSEVDIDSIAGKALDKGWNRIVDSVRMDNTYEVAILTRSGHILFYNYRLDRWCEYSDSRDGVFGTTPKAVSLAFWNDSLIYIAADGHIRQLVRRPNLSSDDTASVKEVSLETGEIQLGTIQNYQRIKDFFLVGRFSGLEELWADVWYNGARERDPSVQAQYPYGQQIMAKLPDQGAENIRVWRFKPQIQKCNSIRIRFRIKCKKAELSAIKLTAVVLAEEPKEP